MGRADVRATIHRDADKDFANRYVVRFHDASVQYDLFPLALEKVNGELDLRDPGGWDCRGLPRRPRRRRPPRRGPVVRLAARAARPDRIYIVIDGDDVPVDTDDFKNALAPSQSPDRAALRHRLGGAVRLRPHELPCRRGPVARASPRDIDVTVAVARLFAQAALLPLRPPPGVGVGALHARPGVPGRPAGAARRQRAEPEAGAGDAEAGRRLPGPLQRIRGAPLAPDADFLEALPDSLRNGLKGLHLTRAADGDGRPGGGLAGARWAARW